MNERLYEQLYEAACISRRRQRELAGWYKRQYREAERARKRMVNGVLGVLTGLGSLACVAAWAVMIAG